MKQQWQLKRAILCAIFSFTLLVTCAYGADDWSADFDIGLDVSAYNTDKANADEGFSDAKMFLGISARQRLSERLSLVEDIHFKSLNAEQGDYIARDVKSVDVELGAEYDLSRWIRLRSQTEFYMKVTCGFLFLENSGLDQDNFNTNFIGFGWKYNNPASKIEGSYIEIGTGASERFDSSWRFMKNEIKFLYKLNESGNGWKAFISSQLDIGTGDDDFRFAIGLTRDALFVADLLKGIAGKK